MLCRSRPKPLSVAGQDSRTSSRYQPSRQEPMADTEYDAGHWQQASVVALSTASVHHSGLCYKACGYHIRPATEYVCEKRSHHLIHPIIHHLLYSSRTRLPLGLPHPRCVDIVHRPGYASQTNHVQTTPADSEPGNPPVPCFCIFRLAVPIPLTPAAWSSPNHAFFASPNTPFPR